MLGKTNRPLQPSAGKASRPRPLLTQQAPGSKTQRGPSQLQALEPGRGWAGGLRGQEHGLCALHSFWGLIQALLGSTGPVTAFR